MIRLRLEAWFRPVIDDNKRSIRHHVTANTRAKIIPGGFGRSAYLTQILSNEFEGITVDVVAPTPQGADEPVAFGALMRYEEIKARGLGAETQSFGIATVEEYHPSLYPDARPNGTNPTRRQRSQFYANDIVYERF